MPVVFNPFTGNLDLIDNTAAAGSDTQVQFNDGGVLGGDGGLVFNKTTNALTGGSFIPTSSTVPTNGVYSPGADQVAISTNGTGRLFVDASGNVGVGTSSPSDYNSGADDLVVFNSGDSGITIAAGNTSVGNIFFADGTSGVDRFRGFIKYSHSDNSLSFGTDAGEQARIDSSGRLGLGTSSPAELLHLSGGDGTNTDINSVNTLINISDINSRYNGTSTIAGNFTSGIIIDAYQANGNRRSGSFIYQVVSSNNFAGGGVGMRTSLVFGTRGDDVGPTDSPLERLRIDSSGNVGIGTTSPGVELHVDGDIRCDGVYGETDTNTSIQFPGSDVITFNEGGSEAARIDSSGRLLVGTSTSRGDGSPFQVVNDTANPIEVFRGQTAIFGPTLILHKSRGSTASPSAVSQDDELGAIAFKGYSGAASAYLGSALIRAFVDGQPDTSGDTTDMPGRLVFSVTADGASSPTEALRITNDRYVRLASGSLGIQFNGDTAAANALDDYEEGTWTPSLEFGGATTGIIYDARQGYYVKTGKIVHIWLYFNLSNKGSATGTATVTGLPFTSEDFNVSGLSVWPGSKPSRRQNELSSDFAMSVLENNSRVRITNGAGAAVTDSTFTNGTIIECALCYRAA